MVFRNDLQTQGMRGPHSFVGLLFSFQRPSLNPRSEKLLSSRALTAAESRGQPFCVKGERLLPPSAPVRQEENRDLRLEPPPDARRVDFYINPPHPSSLPGGPSAPPFRPKGRCFYPFPGTSSTKRQVFLSATSDLPATCRFAAEGASFTRGPRGCQASDPVSPIAASISRKAPHSQAFFPGRSVRPVGAPPAADASRDPGAQICRSPKATSRRSRRRRRSARPARRVRSCDRDRIEAGQGRVELVVHEHVVVRREAAPDLVPGRRQAAPDHLVTVGGTPAEAPLELGHRGRDHEHGHRVAGKGLLDLLAPLHVDVEERDASRRASASSTVARSVP